jgi:hypothetical protein
MPFLGLGLHAIIALFFAVHAIRSGQQMYWLIILFSFPLLGSMVYFFAIYLPNSRLEVGAKRALSSAVKVLDPTRELRDAQSEFEATPTAQNQMRLALAQLEAGQTQAAAQSYEACLKGPFASDPEIKYCAARALVECGRFAPAIGHLQAIRAENAAFRAEALALLLARALQGDGQNTQARAEFEAAVQRFGSFESKAEFAIWAYQTGDTATAGRLQAELDQTMGRWNAHNRELNQALVRRLKNATKTTSVASATATS